MLGCLRATALFVDHPKRPGEKPSERIAQVVTPVDPVVTIAGFAVLDFHPCFLEERNNRAIFVDQGFVHPARDKDFFARFTGMFSEAVHKVDHRVKQGAAFVFSDIRKGKGAGLEEESAKDFGVSPSGGEGGDAAKGSAHESAHLGDIVDGVAFLEEGEDFVDGELGLSGVIGVFLEALDGVLEGDDQGGDFAAVDEVVKDELEGRIAFVVGSVVDDQEGIASSGSEASGEIDGEMAFSAVGLAIDLDIFECSSAAFGIFECPFGGEVACALADGVGSKRIVGEVFVEGITDPMAVSALNDFKLVFDAGLVRDIGLEHPVAGAGDTEKVLGGGESKDPMAEADLFGIAAIEEEDGVFFDPREGMDLQEFIDFCIGDRDMLL